MSEAYYDAWLLDLKSRPWIILAVAFFGLLAYSVNDLLYLALGKPGVAYITESYDTSRRGSHSRTIEFDFEEPDGFRRQGKARTGGAALDWPVGGEIQIQYLPRWFPAGPDGARLARPFNWVVLSLLILSGVGFAIFAWRAIAGGQDDNPRVVR